jgi:hypothetical protein
VLFVVRTLRHRGRIVPWRQVTNRAPLYGDLRVEHQWDEELRRHVRMARLLNPATPGYATAAPTLFDVQLIAMSPATFTLAGFERIDGVDLSQSWLVTRTEGTTANDTGSARRD